MSPASGPFSPSWERLPLWSRGGKRRRRVTPAPVGRKNGNWILEINQATMSSMAKKSGWGGKRPGAGRKPGGLSLEKLARRIEALEARTAALETTAELGGKEPQKVVK